MLPFLFLILTLCVKDSQQGNVTADQQLLIFKQKTLSPIGTLTTSAGTPVEFTDTEVINSNLIFNEFFMDSITHFTREKIPARIVHAKGAGASGYFEVTHDVTDVCKAKLFSVVGKKTPIVIRFSTVLVEKGGSDNSREPRGFAVKFYTEDGNFDIVGLDNEMFIVKDPIFFTAFIHAFKRNPKTNLKDNNMRWDFITRHPESIHMMLRVYGDRGIPDGYRYMPGYGIHTFQVVNDSGQDYFVKFHILPDAGIRNLTSEKARAIACDDLDYASRDLYNAISSKNYPSWTLSIQVATLNDVNNTKFDLFDITKVWPVGDYPLRPIGRIVLNKNPDNYFADIEQLAYSPSNLVPGILGGVDKLFEARRLVYRDALLYRLGTNFNKIDVNCPLRTHAYTYNRDGVAPVKDNEKDVPNYFPNSFNGPIPYSDKKVSKLLEVHTDRTANNFDQASYLYTHGMTEGERVRLVSNIVYSLSRAAKFLQDRAIKLFNIIHPDFGRRVAYGLWEDNAK